MLNVLQTVSCVLQIRYRIFLDLVSSLPLAHANEIGVSIISLKSETFSDEEWGSDPCQPLPARLGRLRPRRRLVLAPLVARQRSAV